MIIYTFNTLFQSIANLFKIICFHIFIEFLDVGKKLNLFLILDQLGGLNNCLKCRYRVCTKFDVLFQCNSKLVLLIASVLVSKKRAS